MPSSVNYSSGLTERTVQNVKGDEIKVKTFDISLFECSRRTVDLNTFAFCKNMAWHDSVCQTSKAALQH